jgi:hypothetical protein
MLEDYLHALACDSIGRCQHVPDMS